MSNLKILFLLVITAITFTIYSFYVSILDQSSLDPGFGGANSIGLSAIQFTFISTFGYLVCLIEIIRWEKTGDYLLLNKIFRCAVFPCLCLITPIFSDIFLLTENITEVLFQTKTITYVSISWILFCDPIRIISKTLIADGIIENAKPTILYATFPPRKFSDMYLSILALVGSCLFVILF